jgi:hypothetical protein
MNDDIYDDGGTAEAPTDKIRVLADRFYRWKNARDDAKAVLDNIDRQYAESEADLFEAIENAGLSSVRTPEGLFSLNDLAWPKIDDRDLLLAWAEAEHPDFLTLNLQRLQTPLREALRNGDVLPPGLGYSVTRKIRTTTTRR